MSDPTKLLIGQVSGSALTDDSMAQEIYDELVAQAPLGTLEDPLPRQKLAIAIAAGVIRHLQKHGQAFHVDVADSGVAKDRRITVD